MLLAVHISDGVMRPDWLVAGFALAGLLCWLGSLRIRDEEIPRIALVTSVFFVLTTIHIKVPPTSVHLLGNSLAGVILGPRAALAIFVGLLLQTMLLGHGGIFTLGVNTCIMTLPALGAWLAFRELHRLPWLARPWCRSLLVGLAMLLGILAAVYSCTLLWGNLLVDVDDFDLGPANAVTFNPLTLAVALAATCVLTWLERKMENAPEFPLGLLIGEATVLATVGLNFLALLLGSETTNAAPPLILLVCNLPLAVIEGIMLGITVGFLKRVKPDILER